MNQVRYHKDQIGYLSSGSCLPEIIQKILINFLYFVLAGFPKPSHFNTIIWRKTLKVHLPTISIEVMPLIKASIFLHSIELPPGKLVLHQRTALNTALHQLLVVPVSFGVVKSHIIPLATLLSIPLNPILKLPEPTRPKI
jgi:hypothetical protein